MRKKFATNLIFLFAVNLLIKPYWIFAIDRVVQNKVGAEVYGTYFAVFNVSFIFAIVLDFGINNFNNRAISRSKKRLGEYVANLMTIKFLLSLVYFVITFLYAYSSGMGELQIQMLTFLAINQVLLSAILYFRSNIAALQLFKTDSLISVLDRLLTILVCSVLMYAAPWRESFNILWFIYAQTFALLVTAFIAMAVVLSQTQLVIKFWDLKFSKLILLKSLPFAVLALLMSIYTRVDVVLLERMLAKGSVEAGVYAASFRLLDAVNMFGYLFSVLLFPMFAAMIRKRENVFQLVKFSGEMMFVFSFVCATLCFFFQQEIMTLLYDHANGYWASVFGLLMLSFVPMSSVYVFGTLLTANGSLKTLIQISLVGVVLNVALNYFLIPIYGAWGCALSAIVTQLAVAGLHLVAAKKILSLPVHSQKIFALLGFCLLCVLSSYLLLLLPAHWLVQFVLAGLASLIIAAAFGLLPLQEALKLVKGKLKG